jgi:hypothetical protein
MLNFRYHVVSLVAVFLALAIGVIMGSTVIDQTLVDQLESQQQQLRVQIEDEREVNAALEGQVETLTASLAQMDEATGDRLVAGTLDDVPVLVVGARGGEPAGLDELLALVDAAGGVRSGQLWFTERMALAEDADRTELASALAERPTVSTEVLGNIAVRRVTDELRVAAGAVGDGVETEPPTAETPTMDALIVAGFIEVEAPDGTAADDIDILPGTRVVLAVAEGTGVADGELMERVAGDMIEPGRPSPTLPVVAVTGAELDPGEERAEVAVIERFRTEAPLADEVSTVDNIDLVMGRLAAVLALDDLGEDRTGHYGMADGAAGLLPPPVPADAGE